jgi:hypothetical protein
VHVLDLRRVVRVYRRLALLAALVAGTVVVAGSDGPTAQGASGACPEPRAAAAYTKRVLAALSARRDVWGDELLARPGGPSYAAARRYLRPLLLARAAGGKALTDSGVYYLPFAQPAGPQGAGSVALHVADGSQIVSQRAGGRSLTVWVGRRAQERYGACLARLSRARVASGYLPILQTGYVDGAGARYRQESFAARTGGSLVSYVRLSVDTAARGVRVRLGSAVARSIGPESRLTVYATWPSKKVDASGYEAARESVVSYWRKRLAEGTSIDVPEQRVLDAERAVLIQNLALTWRYSIGNAYEEFSFPESVDVAEVMAELGHQDVARSMLRTSLTRRPVPYPNWKKGERLVASAEYFRLFHDRAYLDRATPVLRGYVASLGRQIVAGTKGLLGRERYSSDIPDSVYGLHSQTVVWQGLRAMADAWAQTGRRSLAANCRRLAAQLEAGLRRAVRLSERRLPDGSLFIPVRLLDDERPYDTVTQERAGSYWNLVVPFALASGFFPTGGREADGVWRYMQLHGSRLLGLVRAGAYALYGRNPAFPISGTDQVYGLNVARFLADRDEAEQLVLSLYGELAAAMTPDTFVSGEGATVAPLAGLSNRAMYLPPNGASNAAFLETLRVMLVHETLDRTGKPHGLQLAYATPRAWLRPGKRIAVTGAPTSFGPVSFTIEAGARSIVVAVDVPAGRPKSLRLRLRLPGGQRITGVTLQGRPYRRVDVVSGTIDLTGRRGPVELTVRHVQGRKAA